MISKRLKELREEKNLLQKDVAKYLNITTSAYGYYEQGKRKSDIETTKKLADFYDVSTDYLLGRTDNKEDYTKSNINLYNNKTGHLNYRELEKKVTERFLDEGIIIKDEPIPKNMFEKVLKYGTETAIEILKLEKKLEE